MLGSDLSITSSDIGSFPLYTLPGPSGTRETQHGNCFIFTQHSLHATTEMALVSSPCCEWVYVYAYYHNNERRIIYSVQRMGKIGHTICAN